MQIQIVDAASLAAAPRAAMAHILVAAFAAHWPDAWPTLAAAQAELDEFADPARVCRVALAAEEVLGWVGGIRQYDGEVWELHPLAVAPAYQRQGVGRALVADLERQVVARRGRIVMLGSDDEDGMTSLAGQDLFPDPLKHLAALADRKGHPFGFYRKLGYAVIGVIPDANGPGKPDILMAKRVAA